MIRKVLLIIGLTVVIVLVVIAFSLLLILQGTCVTKPRALSLHLNNDSALSAITAEYVAHPIGRKFSNSLITLTFFRRRIIF